jgi:hypothetical protein
VATVEIVGLDQVVADGSRFVARGGPLEQALTAAGTQAAQPVVAAVRSAVPHDSGDMASSVTTRRSTDDAGYAGVEVGYNDLVYAGPVDFGGWPEGRDYRGGGRYLFPAAEPLTSAAQAPYSDATQRAIDGFNWSRAT